MNFGSILLWGFVATIVLTAMMQGGQSLGLSRMSLPFMLGTMFTPNRDRAAVIGFLVHLLAGMQDAYDQFLDQCASTLGVPLNGLQQIVRQHQSRFREG